MPDVNDVRRAISDGNLDKARQMLKVILEQDPTAEAWVLAAQLTTDKDLKVRYLQRAVLLDPGHIRAKEQLRALGAKAIESPLDLVRGSGGTIDVRSALSPLVAMIPRPVLIVVIVLVALVPLSWLVNGVVSVLNPPVTPTPTMTPPTPTALPFQLWQPQLLADHFAASGLPVIIKEVVTTPSTTTPLVKGRVVMDYLVGGQAREVRLVFYDSPGDADQDRDRLKDLDWEWGIQNQNAILIYNPANLSGDDLQRLLEVLSAALTPEEVQSNILAATPESTVMPASET